MFWMPISRNCYDLKICKCVRLFNKPWNHFVAGIWTLRSYCKLGWMKSVTYLHILIVSFWILKPNDRFLVCTVLQSSFWPCLSFSLGIYEWVEDDHFCCMGSLWRFWLPLRGNPGLKMTFLFLSQSHWNFPRRFRSFSWSLKQNCFRIILKLFWVTYV